ncbi:MAG: SLBB domain-containing protein [Treponema sp.]|nr:SLBB domain-containing protein [Treponema sp.]
MKSIKKILSVTFLISFLTYAEGQSLSELKAKYSKSDSSKTITSGGDVSKFSDKIQDFDSSTLDSDSTTAIIPNPQIAMSVSYYPVTAGDVYTLGFAAGSTPVTYSIPVDSTYKIRIANMGVINCKGLTYLDLKSQVESLVLRNYPMAGVQFVLSAPSTFLVNVMGEVNRTVQRNAWALTRLSTIVNRSMTSYSSSRDITIESSDGTRKSYDLFMAMRKGDLSQDPFLRPDDKIIVNRAKRIVSIEGAVERPGTYELLDGENLKELIEIYGNGLEPLADTSRIEFTRNESNEPGAGKKTYISQEAIDSNMELQSYDFITIESFADSKPVVFLEGAINKSVETSLEASNKIAASFIPGEDYAFFARRNKNWFTSSSDLANAYIIRKGETIPLNLNPMLYDSEYSTKIEMLSNDTLVIPFKQFFISVAGAVAKPGRYPYIPDRTWEYYIGLAGGVIKNQNSMDAVVIKDVNGKTLSKDDYITPECTITAKTNSFYYYFSLYSPVIVTVLSVVGSTLSIMAATGAL